jgi:hypothetical protein
VATEGITERDLVAVGKILAGKKNAFPIAGTRASCEHDDHDAEDPLLVDPTRREAAAHLTWSQISDRNAHQLSVAVARQTNGKPDRYGEKSIAL